MRHPLCLEHEARRVAQLVAITLVSAASASAIAQESGTAEDPYVFEDDLAREVAAPETPRRVEDPPVEQPETTEPKGDDDALGVRLLARFGGNYAYLSGPTDPVGEPTLLYGAAYSGWGLQGGVGVEWEILDVIHSDLRVDLVWSQGEVSGLAEDAQAQSRQTIELSSTSLRVPILVQWRSAPAREAADQGLVFYAGLGPEVLIGLGSGAVVVNEGIPEDPEPLYTTQVFHVGVSAALGAALMITERVRIPIDARLTWDPFVPRSTRERFEGYVSFEEPGSYQIAYDLQLALSLGVGVDF